MVVKNQTDVAYVYIYICTSLFSKLHGAKFFCCLLVKRHTSRSTRVGSHHQASTATKMKMRQRKGNHEMVPVQLFQGGVGSGCKQLTAVHRGYMGTCTSLFSKLHGAKFFCCLLVKRHTSRSTRVGSHHQASTATKMKMRQRKGNHEMVPVQLFRS